MAYSLPKDLDGFIPHLSKADTRFRLQVGTDLLAFLAEPSNSVYCQDIGLLIDGLIPWMQSSNYKVSSNGIEVMTYLIDRLGTDFRPYLQTVLPNVIDRLGDAKDTVREKAQLLILKLLERNVLSPQTLLEKLTPGFTHKNAKIREEVLRCLLNTLNEHGAQSLTISRFIPDIVKLLSDPTSSVRDTAFNTLVDLYKHVGEKLRVDLQRRNIVPPAKWQALSARFDEVKDSGELLLTATRNDYCTDEIDRAAMQKPVVPVKKANLGSAAKPRTLTTASSANAVLSRVGSLRKLPFSSGSAGSVDEETFTKSFEDVPPVRIFSPREVSDHMKNIYDTISDPSKEWNKRVDALKKIRSLILADAMNFEEFHQGLKQLDIPLQAIIKDLRSQVVREGCITIAYLAQILGSKFDRTAEMLLLPLINLIQNSAKIMSTSGIVTLRFIIQNIHSPRLIPIITTHAATSKSKDIRRYCCEFLDYILNNWPTHSLEKHVAALQEAVKKGIADADPEARVSSRKAFRGFREHFPDQAEALVQSLEPSYRRALQGDGMSASSSNNNLASGFKTPRVYGRSVATPYSATGSTENLSGTGSGLHRAPSLPRSYRQRSGIPVLSKENSGRKGFRSNSAIDLQAAQRAKVRSQYAAMARNKIASGTASLPRPRKTPETAATQSPERLGRTRNRNSQSQPTSRSGSPSSRLAYLYNRSTEHDSPRPRRLSSGIPRSTTGSRDTSRETSPNRSTLGRFRRGSDRPPLSPASRPVLAQKILQQSREAENALADVLQNDSTDHYRSPRKSMRSIDNHSDESETSSVCSERSFDSFRRPSDSYSWSGSQQRLSSRELWEPCRDINEIIVLCASTVWQERKDGLLSLQHYLSTEVPLTPGELKHLTEIFTKMFMDSHTKGLSVFLDTLHEVIKMHKNELHSWVYVLLQRVFVKIGTETLNSVQSKLMATLDIIRANFPIPLLISNVYRFLADATQTPGPKVKTVVLTFLTALCNSADGSQLTGAPPANQALQKIIAFTQDTKSVELRNAAKICIVAMWNCNTPLMTMMLSELPKEQQDVARNIVHNHMRKNSTGSEPGSPSVNASPKTLSPGTPPLREGLDQEEIYRSLRKTTAEIQNYSYETLSSKLDRDRDTTSQDSGISQMSVGNDVKNEIGILEERMEELNIRANFNSRSGPRSLPPFTSVNGISDSDYNGYKSLGEWKDTDIIKNILEKCVVDHPTPIQEKRLLLSQLINMIKQGQTDAVIQNFKKLLRLLIDNLNEKDMNIRITVLEILRAIFESKEMKNSWSGFVELLTLKVLAAHCDEKKEVLKAAEQTAAAMVVCPFNTTVMTLASWIQTSEYPPILGAIKMLTKLIEANAEDVTDEHLGQIMPGLIKGTDHAESPVRKSSIFCMVALYKAVGEERLNPYISCLSGSKLKLLRLYISRSRQNTTSVPTSPKNTATS
ncbi:CLIP-associating protein isoform X2 [Tribolium castaneum]|uniref:CLIP-associating protein isoform X2 n=1 Tax=Tribolium castaneum TaxID=7070 RepID=UPI00077D9F74|nr:PREDICTED: CLIP-associating protein isoform X2 [Tribolium castaneum]|eukprot:XP_015837159.1 PREDICTED: CLIP-associating protein isoform X2 [Tribolium castaneum]